MDEEFKFPLTTVIVSQAETIAAVRAAIAYIRTRIETGHFRSDYQRGELSACEQIEKAMNGGGE